MLYHQAADVVSVYSSIYTNNFAYIPCTGGNEAKRCIWYEERVVSCSLRISQVLDCPFCWTKAQWPMHTIKTSEGTFGARCLHLGRFQRCCGLLIRSSVYDLAISSGCVPVVSTTSPVFHHTRAARPNICNWMQMLSEHNLIIFDCNYPLFIMICRVC